MTVQFKSPADASFICTDKVASLIIKAIGKKNINKGIITVDEVNKVLNSLEEQIESENLKKEKKTDGVSFSIRVFPLIKMLKKAHSSNDFVLWEKL